MQQPKMLYKTTNRLFKGTYQYKIVLICATASVFRSGDMDSALAQIKKINVNSPGIYSKQRYTQYDVDLALALHSALSKMPDIEIRVESPWISIYTNSMTYIDQLKALDEKAVKYISMPPTGSSLDIGTIIMPKVDFEFRVTLGKTTSEHSTFVQWAEASDKLRLTKSCKKDLLKQRSWGGTHFYITGDKTLLMAKMHLGGSIAKIERIIKA
jgi:hypothetical protein